MDEMNMFVRNDGKFYKEDQDTIANAWREFFTFCCLILPEKSDAYSLMQKSFPTKYDVNEYKANFVAYMKENYHAKHTKMTIFDRFAKEKKLSIKCINAALYNYKGSILNVVYFQQEVEGFLHSKVEYEEKAIKKVTEEFSGNDELEVLDVRRDRFVFLDALSNQTVENLEWLSFYLGITKRDDNTYHYTTLAVTYTGMNYVNVLSLISTI